MALRDLDETGFDPDLHLPIRGKRYTVTAPSYEEWKRLVVVVADSGMPAVEQTNEALKILGPAVDQMAADNVPWPMILHAGRTALLHFAASPDLGEIHWAMAHLGRLIDLERVSEQLAAKRKKK